MRVIAGTARRIQLETVKGNNTRPTTDRIKETLFNIINNDLYDIDFLDLFSGSGAIGIEALSRGANSATFVENNRNAIKCIETNLEKTNLKEQGNIVFGDVMRSLESLQLKKQKFHIIFMDPPYNKQLENKVLEFLKDSCILDNDTLIIVEASLETDFSFTLNLGYEIKKEKIYKTNKHVFLKKLGE